MLRGCDRLLAEKDDLVLEERPRDRRESFAVERLREVDAGDFRTDMPAAGVDADHAYLVTMQMPEC